MFEFLWQKPFFFPCGQNFKTLCNISILFTKKSTQMQFYLQEMSISLFEHRFDQFYARLFINVISFLSKSFHQSRSQINCFSSQDFLELNQVRSVLVWRFYPWLCSTYAMLRDLLGNHFSFVMECFSSVSKTSRYD